MNLSNHIRLRMTVSAATLVIFINKAQYNVYTEDCGRDA